MKRAAAIRYLDIKPGTFDLAVQMGKLTPDSSGEYAQADLDSYKAQNAAPNALAIPTVATPVIARPEPPQQPESRRLPFVPVHRKFTLSIEEAAALAGISRATVLRAIVAGELKTFSGYARGRRIRRSDLAAWVDGWK